MNRTVYIKTTGTCNLNCEHCFTNGSSGDKTNWIVEDVIAWGRRYINHIDAKDSVHFELHGGEPFLVPIPEMKRFVESIGNIRNDIFVTFGATSNLVFKLTPEHHSFIRNELSGSIGTSWDPNIRFKNKKQETLWLSNVKTLIDEGIRIVLNISLSPAVINIDIKYLLKWIKELGIAEVSFERITPDGSAFEKEYLFQNNKAIDKWFFELHLATKELNAREWFYNRALEEIYTKFEHNLTHCGTYCRNCEQKIFTINSNGTIGGCPNTATKKHYGHINQDIVELNSSSERLKEIISEADIPAACYKCPVFNQCGSGCHQLTWDGDICPSPKTLMMYLAGLPDQTHTNMKYIPIFRKD